MVEVVIHNGDTKANSTDSEYIKRLLANMAVGEDTGEKSTKDRPNGDTAIQIDLSLKNGESNTVFMYFGGGNLFLELPHKGIYTVDKKLDEVTQELK